MNKMNAHFWKYSLTLLIVAFVFIAIGSISLSRTSQLKDNRIIESISVKDRIAELSNANVELQTKNSQLETENKESRANTEQLKAQNDALLALSETSELFDNKDYENAKQKLDTIDTAVLPESILNYYNKLSQNIKERLE